MTTQPRNGGVVHRIRTLPEEVLFFGRLSIYGLAIGTVYWFLTYEGIGTVLLLAVGGGSGVFTLILLRRLRRGGPAWTDAESTALEGPFADAGGRLPTSSFAPLEVGIGIAVAGLSLAFGAWLALAAVVPLLGGFLTWLRAAEAEYWAVEADDAADDAAVESMSEETQPA